MEKTMEDIIMDKNVLNHLFILGQKLKEEYHEKNTEYSAEAFEALKDSPITTQWIKEVVLPGIYNGDEGLDSILNNIENEKNILLGASRMQIVLEVLKELNEPLFKIQEANENGEYSLEQNLKKYEQDKRIFKMLH
jgi:tRNA pseudouridine-54 N-methylase